MFKNAIVRKPGMSMVNGITSAALGQPDYEKALRQHKAYISVLNACGLTVAIMDADEKYPDSCFIEDTAVVFSKCAIITRLGAPSRQGEEIGVHSVLEHFFPPHAIHLLKPPGTLEGGDVMKVDNHFYVGLSQRTNMEGFQQFSAILGNYGASASLIPMKQFLHLKTGLAYLENNNLLIAGEFISEQEFEKFNRIMIAEAENYAANCIWVNGTVLVPLGFPQTLAAIKDAGYPATEVDLSEFRKLDGGLSCLSLRF